MFEWDEAKSEANLTARGFDFAYATRIISARLASRKERDLYEDVFG
jgi:uncharacterized DUF497 family protein